MMAIPKRPNNARMTASRPSSKNKSPTKHTVAAEDAGKKSQNIRKVLEER
jgi:hypothetical protein